MDPCSQSNIEEFKTTHLNWTVAVDFTAKILKCTATFKVECVSPSDRIVLDTRSLNVRNAQVNGLSTAFELGKEHEVFGVPLIVHVPEEFRKQDAKFTIRYVYDKE